MKVDYGEYFPIAEYYKKVVVPLDKRFRNIRKDKFVCCLHDDTDPSLGIIHSKDKGEIFHCFGCNAWGNVVDLHKRVSLKYFNKYIDEDRAVKELSDIFGINYKDLPSTEDALVNDEDKDIRKQLAMREAMNSFDSAYFQQKIIEGKLEGKSIPYFNTLLVRMIDSEKKRSSYE